MSEKPTPVGMYVGAKAMARRYFGRDDERAIRRIRYLSREISKESRLKTFKVGGQDATNDELIAEHLQRLHASAQ